MESKSAPRILFKFIVGRCWCRTYQIYNLQYKGSKVVTSTYAQDTTLNATRSQSTEHFISSSNIFVFKINHPRADSLPRMTNDATMSSNNCQSTLNLIHFCCLLSPLSLILIFNRYFKLFFCSGSCSISRVAARKPIDRREQ